MSLGEKASDDSHEADIFALFRTVVVLVNFFTCFFIPFNNFISNPNFSAKHKVKEDETLGHILYSYYGKSGLNLRIVEMAIVEFNPKSFRNRNPNFLFANQSIYLPSLNEMKDLVLGKSKNQNKKLNNNNSKHIYFFGG